MRGQKLSLQKDTSLRIAFKLLFFFCRIGEENMFCYKCGTELPENANFCLNCGVRTARGAEAKVPLPYREMFSDMEKTLEKSFLTASVEMKNAFNKAKDEVRKAANR